MHSYTPWGKAQTSSELAIGVEVYTTASHGGFWLSDERLAQMPDRYAKVGEQYCPRNWFEEDCEWALVALSFPELFSDEDVEAARTTYEHGWLDYAIAPEYKQGRKDA